MTKRLLTVLLSVIISHFLVLDTQAVTPENQPPTTFEMRDGHFLLGGKPFVIKAAELHYPRIPRPYWEHRIQMCKALGMNTICLYIFWNIHEQQPGQFDFTEGNDVRHFIQLCQKHGLWVIVRPGPYVCAEWEMGGLPWWLLKHEGIRLREEDPYFLERVEYFEKAVGEQIADLTVAKGGPILMVQVENEYGSYGQNKPYVSRVRDILRRSGFEGVTLFQCDWSSNFQDNALPDLLWTMNFGAGAHIPSQFQKVKELRPDAPLMCSEYWSGWFDGWGRAHETRPAETMVSGIRTMLDAGISFSLYMTHGGTSFGHWAGANNTGYAPDCTSYDYDAPINEQGSATPKYHQLRQLLQQYSEQPLPAIPSAIPVISIPEVRLTEMAPLFRAGNMPEAIPSAEIQTMEHFDQGYGSILYTTTLPHLPAGSVLEMRQLHDYAIVYIDGKEVGRSYRGSTQNCAIQLEESTREGAQLELFVEAMGRINYSRLIHDPKGITEKVLVHTTDGKNRLTIDLRGWDVRLYPVSMDHNDLSYIPVPETKSTAQQTHYPAYYRGTFRLRRTGDTFLDLRTWGKGMVWVNGHNLGRYWNVGPQQTLYLPGCWLKKGENEVVILDIAGPEKPLVKGLTTPIISELHPERMPQPGVSVEAVRLTPLHPDHIGNDAAPGAR